MKLPKGQRLLIARTPNWEGLVYEAASENKSYSLSVNSENDTQIIKRKPQFGFGYSSSLLLTFNSSNILLLARLNLQTSDVDFYLPDGKPQGRVREAKWSLWGKSIVEDESNQTLGWIDYGFKKDRVFSGDGRSAGFIIRCPHKFMYIPDSKAHLYKRFELVNEGEEFDERLAFAWISQKIFSERSS